MNIPRKTSWEAMASWPLLGSLLVSFSTSMAIGPEDRLFQSLSQTAITGDREPIQGSVRTDPNQTDIRTVFQGPDGKEIVISLWSPRVHPFKAPPSYLKVRPCLFGEYFETTIGITDINKTQIYRQSGRDQKLPEAYIWNDKILNLASTSPLNKVPQKYEFIGKVFEFEKTGRCNYHPVEKKQDEDSKVYFYKHLEIARKANATDIIFPKTTFNLIKRKDLSIPTFEYELPLSNLSDLRIDFNQSTFLLPPGRGGFIFENSQRIVVSKVTLEWAKPELFTSSLSLGPAVHGFYSPRKNNSDLWFENITLKRVPGWGFYFESTKGALISDSMISQVEGDSIPAAREGAVLANNSQNVIVRNNSFDNLESDGISLHGQLAQITTPVFTPQLKTIEPGFSNCVGLGSSWFPYAEGETLAFFSKKLEFQGEIKLRSVQTFAFTDPGLPAFCKGFSHCSQVCFGPHPEFKPEEFGFATSVNNNSGLFIIHGNTFSNIKGTAISIQGSNGIIAENTINNTGGPGIQLGADVANHLKGPGAFNIILRNNLLKRVAHRKETITPDEVFFGGIAMGATYRDRDGRRLILNSPLVQHIRIEGTRSRIEDSGSVALQIASTRNLEIRALTLGAAGVMRTLSSGTLTGSPAEGSVLINRSGNIDLSGLTTPAMVDMNDSRSRTIVVDGQNVSHLRLPITTKAIPGRTANTVWNLTFRSFFKENPGGQFEPVTLNLESPALSSFFKQPPITAFSIVEPKVGDKEQTILGKAVSLTTTSSQWTATVEHAIQSPNRIQLRPYLRKRFFDLFITIENINMTQKKSNPLPFES